MVRPEEKLFSLSLLGREYACTLHPVYTRAKLRTEGERERESVNRGGESPSLMPPFRWAHVRGHGSRTKRALSLSEKKKSPFSIYAIKVLVVTIYNWYSETILRNFCPWIINILLFSVLHNRWKILKITHIVIVTNKIFIIFHQRHLWAIIERADVACHILALPSRFFSLSLSQTKGQPLTASKGEEGKCIARARSCIMSVYMCIFVCAFIDFLKGDALSLSLRVTSLLDAGAELYSVNFIIGRLARALATKKKKAVFRYICYSSFLLSVFSFFL